MKERIKIIFSSLTRVRYLMTRMILPTKYFILYFFIPLLPILLLCFCTVNSVFQNERGEAVSGREALISTSISIPMRLMMNGVRDDLEEIKDFTFAEASHYFPSLTGVFSAMPGYATESYESSLLGDGTDAPELSLSEKDIFFPVRLPSGYIPIIRSDLAYDTFDIINDTDYYIDRGKIDKMEYPFSAPKEGQPTVLIIHTHATESFYEEEKDIAAYIDTNKENDKGISGYYKEGSAAPRTEDTSRNMVHIGEIFAERLNSLGVYAIQDRTLHDLNNYNGAYSSSYKSMTEYIKKYPSIQYIIDIHRDSLIKADGTKMNPSFIYEGESTAQVMLVVGTNQSGYYHPNWRSNLSLALKYKSLLNEAHPDLVRPIYLRTGRFNQQLSAGSMLLEIGSCGSSLKEAENAALLAADALARLIKGE